jgi:NADH-quinone oxidoreductase subunit J
MVMVLLRGFWTEGGVSSPAADATFSNTHALGLLIFTHYTYAFEIAAAILLLGIVAAVVLTLHKRKDTKHLDPALAIKVKSSDRVRIIKMRSEENINSGLRSKINSAIPATTGKEGK